MADEPYKFEDATAPQDQATDRLLEAWRWVLHDRRGRAVIRDLLRVSHYGVSAFSGKDNDTTNMISGKQKVGEEIMSLMNAVNPEAFFIMTKEAREDEAHDRANTEHSRRDGAEG